MAPVSTSATYSAMRPASKHFVVGHYQSPHKQSHHSNR